MYFPNLRTLDASVAFHARRRPDHAAVLCERRTVTYGELHRRSNRMAHALGAAGVSDQARIGYLGKESEHYYEVLFACAKTGTVLVPINWRLTVGEVDHILRDSRTEFLFVEEEFRALAEKVTAALAHRVQIVVIDQEGGTGAGILGWAADHPDTDLARSVHEDDPVAQLYTSGTTGLPKGVVLAHRSFFRVRDALASEGLSWIDWQEGDVSLIGIPGFHVGGLWWATQGFHAYITNVAMRMFISGEAVRRIRELGVTTACVVPSMLQMMLSEPEASNEDFASLRKVVYGGSPISEPLLEQAVERIGCDFAQIYGLTETGNTAVCLPPHEHVVGGPRMQAAGRAYPGFEIKIVDRDGTRLAGRSVGEVCLRTPAHMIEYWGLPEATASTLTDGWIITGDRRLSRRRWVSVRL